MAPLAVRPMRSSRVLAAAIARPIRGRQQPDHTRMPRQEDLLARLHAGAAFARNLDLQHVRAEGDIELEGVSVIADVLDRAGDDVLTGRSLIRRRDRDVLGADQDDRAASRRRSRRTPRGAYLLAVPELDGEDLAADMRDRRGQEVRVAQE